MKTDIVHLISFKIVIVIVNAVFIHHLFNSLGAKNKPIGRGRGRPRKSQKETAVPPNPARNTGHEWNLNETNTLLDLYYGYMEAGIGPFKRFKTKISMWEKIASDINRKFMLELTRVQVESR